jgi:hypothetical protein
MTLSFKQCALDCGFCAINTNHVCRKCKAINHHRSANCKGKTGCRFNCGFCRPNQEHLCRNCGAINLHMSRNCPNTVASSSSSSSSSSSAFAMPCAVTSVFSKLSLNKPVPVQRTQDSSQNVSSGGKLHSVTRKVSLGRVVSTSAASSSSARQQNQVQTRLPPTPFVKSSIDGKDIKSGVSIFVCYKHVNGVPVVFVHGDNVGRGPSGNRTVGLIMSSGGNIDHGSNALQTASKEDIEEQGAIDGYKPRYYGSIGLYHYFVLKCPANYYRGRVTTPSEVTADPNHIPSKFRSSGVVRTNVPTTWGVPIDDLISNQNRKIVYGPFRTALEIMMTDTVFDA